ncbi:hypothetical protein [Methanobacterium sp. SMA-27]|uniref:hypothetical protein n=1 Tax=Methanobacterium sp. SMA-27 TaxID=1495336 RepID=UPI00064F3F09|nr:hypothetical protein [Methanobacterium sp. SMA-27]
MVLDEKKLEELLTGLEYTEEECEKIIQYFMDLRKDFIKIFLKTHELPTSGKKDEIRKRILENLEIGTINYYDLISFVNKSEPNGKQHIFLYKGPERVVSEWKNVHYFNEFITNNELDKFLDASLPIVPPETLSLKSIKYIPNEKLELYALKYIEYSQRTEELDEKKTHDGKSVDLRAHLNLDSRGMIIFSWDLVSNNAKLQVLQLPSGYEYDQVEREFKELVEIFFDLNIFEKVDLSQVIEKLHILEENGTPEARSHNFDYISEEGRRFSGRSATSKESVIGEVIFDNAMSTIRDEGIGYMGNFYWLAYDENPIIGNVLENEVHTVLLGDESRINFKTPNKAEDLEYVLSRVRELSI